MIECRRQRDDAFCRHFAKRRLEPDNPAARGRNPDRAARVGPDGGERHAGGDADGRSAARSPRRPRQVERIVDGPERRVAARRPEGVLVQVRLADEDGPRRPQAGDARRILKATRPTRTRDAAVVSVPRTSMRSLIESGTPCSGPRSRPAAISRSASLACRRASSAITRMKALVAGLRASIRARHCSTMASA